STTRNIELRSDASSDAIPPQGSLTLGFTSTPPASGGPFDWQIAVKQSNDFRGTNNQFSLTPGASIPRTTIGTCNAGPVASSVNITGTPNVGQTLTGHYTYSDAESDPEGTSTF